MYTISFISPETLSEVQALGVWESERKARNCASSLPYRNVRVWRGQPGEALVASYNEQCDAERFGDSCAVCKSAETDLGAVVQSS
ncbi:MAG: hypothetical protein IRZ07_00685 [Microbispora sp.]|nr:hypothetical protein [Microbispora sp.]